MRGRGGGVEDFFHHWVNQRVGLRGSEGEGGERGGGALSQWTVGASTNLTEGGERFFFRRADFVVVAMEMPESCRVRIDLIGGAERVCTVEQEPMEDTLCRARKTPPL